MIKSNQMYFSCFFVTSFIDENSKKNNKKISFVCKIKKISIQSIVQHWVFKCQKSLNFIWERDLLKNLKINAMKHGQFYYVCLLFPNKLVSSQNKCKIIVISFCFISQHKFMVTPCDFILFNKSLHIQRKKEST